MFESLVLAAALAVQPPLATPDCPAGDRELGRTPDTVCIGATTGAYSFTFVYPRRAAEVPGLEPRLTAEAARARRWLERLGSAPETPFSYEAGWTIDAVTPEIAAVSGAISHYTGGAHGGIEYRVILFDRLSGETLALTDLFRLGTFETTIFGRPPRGMGAAQGGFCRALLAAVRERRGDPAATVDCPAVQAQPVTLVCGATGRIEAFRALLNPYVAGSWAEGPTIAEFPIDARMLASIKRRYRAAFGLPGEPNARIPARPCR